MREHKSLFNQPYNSRGRIFKNYINDSDRWWLIVILVVSIFFILSLINIEVLNFISIDKKTIEIIVDQRAANIATVISITLVVVGFLINNLAVKEPFAYKILFKNSWLYPIIYLTLTTIGCFVLASLFRNWMHHIHFAKSIFIGTYLMILILFSIGWLFRKIIQFTNSKIIEGLLHKELIIEAKEKIIEGLIIKYSKREYNKLMEQMNVSKHNIFDDFDFSTTFDNDGQKVDVKERPATKIIWDINMNFIKKFIEILKKNHENINYEDMYLGKITSEIDDYIWVKQLPNNLGQKQYLKNSLRLRDVKEERTKKDNDEVMKYFSGKLEELTEKSNYKNLETLLESYKELYELQMQHQK